MEQFGGDGVDYSTFFVSDEMFESDTDAINWAKQIALQIGFELIISSHKNNGNVKMLRCNRGERYRGEIRDLEVAVRKNTKTKACKCTFQLRAKRLCGSWVIVSLPGIRGTHNHGFHVYAEGYRQKSGLSTEAKKIVRDMSSAQSKPCAILASLQEKFPDDNATRRHVYNYRDQIRKLGFEDRDVVGQFHHLAVESNYVHWHRANPDTNEVTHVFMAHPTSIQLLRSFPWLIGIDVTYKTNKYKMALVEIVGMTPTNKNFLIAYAIMKDESESSYAWALEKLRLMFGYDVQPTAIVTDRELGLMTPIRDIFPESPHLLCTWHINKCVEDKVYRLCGKNKGVAERFKNGRWRAIMKAPTVRDYDSAVHMMKDSWRSFPAVISYVEETWLIHKEMFVDAWTNKVLHFGNTTTCRVESAHAMLKQWLNTSTGALDSVWSKVNKAIESQLTQIRFTLEECRRRKAVLHSGFPFNYLSGYVSHYCLGKLSGELKRMGELSDQVYDRCGCVLRSTHGIPCACELRTAMDTTTPVSLESVHIFWRTLVISDGAEIPVLPWTEHPSEDHRYFRSLVDEVNSSDPAVVRSVALLIHDQLHPDEVSYVEPPVNTTVRGRPRGSSSTRRDPSSWEYSQSGRGRSRGRGRSSSSSNTLVRSTGMNSFLNM